MSREELIARIFLVMATYSREADIYDRINSLVEAYEMDIAEEVMVNE